MEKLSDRVKSAKEVLSVLEADLSTAQERLKNGRQSKQEAENELVAAKARLADAKKHVEDVIFEMADGKAQPEHLKTARAALRTLAGEIEDFEALISAYGAANYCMETELESLRSQLFSTRASVWSAVRDELRAKFQKQAGHLFLELLAVSELCGKAIILSSSDPILMLVLGDHSPMPKLEEEKAKLVEKYL